MFCRICIWPNFSILSARIALTSLFCYSLTFVNFLLFSLPFSLSVSAFFLPSFRECKGKNLFLISKTYFFYFLSFISPFPIPFRRAAKVQIVFSNPKFYFKFFWLRFLLIAPSLPSKNYFDNLSKNNPQFLVCGVQR